MALLVGELPFHTLIIEHCIMGETLFITSSPHLGAFYNNDKDILFIVIEQAINQ